MRQVVTRRYRKLLEEGGPFPDLIVIDGGKGQLAAAYEALEELGLANLVAIGLAKREELIFTRDTATRSRCQPAIRRCCCSSRSATRRTGLPSPFTARPAACATCGPSSTRCPASAPAGARRC